MEQKPVNKYAANKASRPDKDLSPRELEMVKLFNQGKPYKVIADILGVSISSVEAWGQAVLQKLLADNLRQACYVLRLSGVIKDDEAADAQIAQAGGKSQ